MKIDLNFILKNLAGNDMIVADQNGNVMRDEKGHAMPQHAGRLIANFLANGNSDNWLKYTDWAETLYKGNVLEVDKADKKWLYDYIEKNKSLTDWVKRQLLEAIERSEQKQPVLSENGKT